MIGIGLWAALALAGIVLMVAPLLPPAQAQRPTTPAPMPSFPVSSPQPGERPTPIWLNAPKAAIAGPVIPVGLDAHGNMAAPEGANSDPIWDEAFWWRAGAMPGQTGNAVIAGHLDRKDGSPAIFWNLNKLKVGDSVYVRTALGAALHFVVKDVSIVANPTGGAANPVLQRIFGPAQTANLNLITCAGDWTGTQYNKKLVIFTTLVP